MLAIGLMTGSSMDGIDAAILKSDGLYDIEFIAGHSLSFSADFRLRLRHIEALMQEADLREVFKDLSVKSKDRGLAREKVKKIDAVIKELTYIHFEVVRDLLLKNGYTAKQIDVIGFHGQNLYHNPAQKITIQIGDGQLLADLTGICTINNFRSNDIKLGGQGAPFAPIYHQALAVRDEITPLAMINCGGIANLTLVIDNSPDGVIGYDIGPGNVLLDRYLRQKTSNQEFMDYNGKYGLAGKVHDNLFAKLYNYSINTGNDNFYDMLPPKSLDSRQFNLIEEIFDLSIQDACATLAAFTAHAIARSIKSLPNGEILSKIVISGGGANNPVIMHYLQEYLGEDIRLLVSDKLGWNMQYMEAELIAYLAIRAYLGLHLSMPKTTGVKTPATGGDIFIPA